MSVLLKGCSLELVSVFIGAAAISSAVRAVDTGAIGWFCSAGVVALSSLGEMTGIFVCAPVCASISGWQAVKRISANRLVRDKQNGMRKPAFMSDMSFALIVQNKYRYYRDSFQKVKS